MTNLQALNQPQQQAIIEANIRMTEALLAQLRQHKTATGMLDWLSSMEEQWLYYSDFTKGIADSAWLAGVKTKVSKFVPYLLATCVDPVLKLELQLAKR